MTDKTGPPLLDRISDYVAWYAERSPRAEALVLGARRITYEQLSRDVDALSVGLLAAGVQPGDRIATLSTPHPDFFIVFLAVASIGAIWVGLNPRYRCDELEFVLGDSRPVLVFARTLIAGRNYAVDIAQLRLALPSIRWVALGNNPLDGGTAYADFIAGGATLSTSCLDAVRSIVRPADPALIVYTSGSSGPPKGALLPHRGLALCCQIQYRYWGTRPLRTINFFPINHIGCVGDIACFGLVAGGCTVFLEQFSPDKCLALIKSEQVTLWAGVPTTFLLTLRDTSFNAAQLDSVQRIVWSGAAASRELVDSLLGLGKWLGTSYGLTETVGSMTFTAVHASRQDLIDSVGAVPDEYSLRVVDDEGRATEPGEAGEIQVRGDFLMVGYWQRAEANEEAFTDGGWFRTGDIGCLRPDGNLTLIGRRTETFKSGGYNVNPREVEQVLECCAGVRLAAVVAVPDALYGHVGHAFVLPEQNADITSEGLDHHCREYLANYKVPKRISLTREMPMLPIGKVDKRALATQAAGESALAQHQASVKDGA